MITGIVDRATVLGVIAALCFGAGWKVNGWRLGEGIAMAQVEAVQSARVTETKRQIVADTEGAKGHEDLKQARRDADDARAAAAGLRANAAKLASRLAACNAGSASEREARERAAVVFAGVLEEMEARGRALAEFADQSRSAGLACERVYDGIRAVQ